MHNASFVLVTHRGRLLLILRDKDKDISEPGKWHLLGGGAEEGESPEETARREVKEEANLELTNLTFLVSIEGSTYIYHSALADNEIKNIKLGDEGQRLSFFTLEEIKLLDLTKDIKTALDNPEYLAYLEMLLTA